MTNDEKKFVESNTNDINEIQNIDNTDTAEINDNQSIIDENLAPSDSANEDTTDSNCLSLTIVDDCHHLIKKNTIIKAIRMFFKVTVSTAILNFIKFIL